MAAPRYTSLLSCAFVACIAVFGAWLRFLQIGIHGLWVDEGSSFVIARMDWWNFLRLLWRREANMALYYILLRFWLLFWLLFSRAYAPSEAYLRALSAIFGVAAIIAIYFLAKKMWSAPAGLMAAFLLAIHAYHIRYSQEARGYSLAVFFVILSALLLLRLREKPSSRNAWACAIVGALAVYAHFYSFLVLLAQWLALLFMQGDSVTRAATRAAIRRALLLLIPVALFIIFTGTGPLAWTHRPSWHELHVFAIYMTGGGTDSLVWAYVAAALIAGACAFRRSANWQNSVYCLFVLVWFFFPIVLVLAISFVKPVFANRFFVICVPALCLLASSLAAPAAGKLRLLAIPSVLTLGYLSIGALQHFYGVGLDSPSENWRTAASYVLAQSRPSDGIIFYNSQGRMPFEFYEQRELQSGVAQSTTLPRVIFPAHESDHISFQDFMGKPDAQSLTSAPTEFSRVWLLMCHDKIGQAYDAPTQTIRAQLARGYSQSTRFTYPGIDLELYRER